MSVLYGEIYKKSKIFNINDHKSELNKMNVTDLIIFIFRGKFINWKKLYIIFHWVDMQLKFNNILVCIYE